MLEWALECLYRIALLGQQARVGPTEQGVECHGRDSDVIEEKQCGIGVRLATCLGEGVEVRNGYPR
jgi:hypothetical protein